MPASDSEKARFRRKLGGDITSMPDEYIDDVFDEVEADYAGSSRAVIVAATYVEGLNDLIVQASKDVDYTEGDASQKNSQKRKGLESARDEYKSKLADLIEAEKGPAIRWGSTRKAPPRSVEYPDA